MTREDDEIGGALAAVAEKLIGKFELMESAANYTHAALSSLAGVAALAADNIDAGKIGTAVNRACAALDKLTVAASIGADRIDMRTTECSPPPRFRPSEAEVRGRIEGLISERDWLRRAIREHREAAKNSPARVTVPDKALWATLDADARAWARRA